MVALIWINHQIQVLTKSSPGLRESSELKRLVTQELWILKLLDVLLSALKGKLLIYKFRATRLVKSQQSAGK